MICKLDGPMRLTNRQTTAKLLLAGFLLANLSAWFHAYRECGHQPTRRCHADESACEVGIDGWQENSSNGTGHRHASGDCLVCRLLSSQRWAIDAVPPALVPTSLSGRYLPTVQSCWAIWTPAAPHCRAPPFLA